MDQKYGQVFFLESGITETLTKTHLTYRSSPNLIEKIQVFCKEEMKI